MAESRLLIVGQANMELRMSLSRFPAAGESLVSDGSFRFVPGGRGANSALCASALGTDSLLCTRVGNDLNGRTLKGFYESHGVDTRFVKLDRNRATPLLQTVQEQGQNTRNLLFSGAFSALSDEDLDDAFMAFPDGVLTSFESNEHLFRRTAALAAESGIPLFVDGTRPSFEYPASMPRLEAIVLGEAETYAYTDIFPDCLDNYVRACIRLNAKINSHYFLIRLKGRGTYFTDGKYSEIISTPEFATETTDDSDVFCAALATELIRNKNITEAVRVASAVCGYRQRADKQGAFPTREELLAFCDSCGFTL